ncbi:MAG: glutathione S-transferase family protein [Alphaproteobacteria bacterium]|nr:glutathione S-transferase family protein [Alphaproteobacteria bacterium]
MVPMTLVMGNRNYSSWSLRAWLAMRVAGLTFEEIVIPLDQPDTRNLILEHSPAGRVPVLHHGDVTIWDSLAICEYLAETVPGARLWPETVQARAEARAISAEMHAGFAALREALPMNVRADRPGVSIEPQTQADIDRILQIWRNCRRRFGTIGPFLFGRFSIADAMFAPVVSRFATYRVAMEALEREYASIVYNLPAMRDWSAAAAAEPWVIAAEEIGEEVG